MNCPRELTAVKTQPLRMSCPKRMEPRSAVIITMMLSVIVITIRVKMKSLKTRKRIRAARNRRSDRGTVLRFAKYLTKCEALKYSF